MGSGQQRQKTDQRCGGFTLIELLVVIAIVSILAALLLPSISVAKASALSAACKNNLRQIGVGISIYVSESGFYPRSPFWQDLRPYLKSTNVFQCPDCWGPSAPFEVPKRRLRILEVGYGYNVGGTDPNLNGKGPGRLGLADFAGFYSDETAAESQVKAPSDMVAIGDANLLRLGTPPNYGISAWGWLWPYTAASPEAQLVEHRRHRAIFNLGFCDGHVEAMKRRDIYRATEALRKRWNNDNEPHQETWINTPFQVLYD